MPNRILVTGGAGYIGSHTVLQLVAAGNTVVVLDNLYSGHVWAIPDEVKFYEGDIQDRKLIETIIQAHRIESIVHFAGHIVVPESVENPSKYYKNNVLGSLNLIETSIAQGVRQFVFSSSAAVYGIPDQSTVTETSQLQPINPYGTTKLMTEWTLRDLSHATKVLSEVSAEGAKEDGFNYVALRYFNVAGAHMGGLLGQATPNATHLIKVACQTACGMREKISIFGDDYDTPDGSCVRDYIHVDDLATAHLNAVDYLANGGESQILNCGYGKGFSVKDVIQCVKSVSGVDFDVDIQPRRLGDPPQLIANSDKIRAIFHWQPKYNDLETICRSAFLWEKKLMDDNRKSRVSESQ